MKRVFSFALILYLSTFLFSCEKLKEAFTFEYDTDTEFTLPSTIAVDTPYTLTTPEIETNIQTEMENNNTNADLVESVSLKAMKLSITSPASVTFSFLNSIEIYISAEGQEEVLLAEKQDIPGDVGTEIDLETTGINLKDYLLKDSFDLKITVLTDETILEEIDIRNDMTFEIAADPL